LEESKAAFDSSAAVFLDVRSADTYATGHISGAISIPLAELEARIDELDPDRWIITYCT
jgi:rhodanese-related sulfurtransferase